MSVVVSRGTLKVLKRRRVKKKGGGNHVRQTVAGFWFTKNKERIKEMAIILNTMKKTDFLTYLKLSIKTKSHHDACFPFVRPL